MTDLGDIAALLAAFGFGSIGSAVLSRGREQRGARAAVLAALSDVENRRWYDPKDEPFSAALREFQAAALVARVPWRVVDKYVSAARLAFWLSQDDWNESGGADEYAGGIPTALGEVVRAHSLLVVFLLWRPIWGRVTLRGRLRRIDAQIDALPKKHSARLKDALRPG